MTGFIDELLAEVIGQQVALMSAVARLEARTDGEALHDLRIALPSAQPAAADPRSPRRRG